MPDVNIRCVQGVICMGRVARVARGVSGGPRHVIFRYVGVAGAGQVVWWHRESVGVRSEERIVGAGHMRVQSGLAGRAKDDCVIALSPSAYPCSTRF